MNIKENIWQIKAFATIKLKKKSIFNYFFVTCRFNLRFSLEYKLTFEFNKILNLIQHLKS